MRFWDTSALLPLLVEEATTERIEAEYETDPVMLVWWATVTECSSALARLEREEALVPEDLEIAGTRLRQLHGSWHEVQPVEDVRRTAHRLLRTHTLRAMDALQLAAALVAAEANAATLEMVVLDPRLAMAARREGLALTALPTPPTPPTPPDLPH